MTRSAPIKNRPLEINPGDFLLALILCAQSSLMDLNQGDKDGHDDRAE